MPVIDHNAHIANLELYYMIKFISEQVLSSLFYMEQSNLNVIAALANLSADKVYTLQHLSNSRFCWSVYIYSYILLWNIIYIP